MSRVTSNLIRALSKRLDQEINIPQDRAQESLVPVELVVSKRSFDQMTSIVPGALDYCPYRWPLETLERGLQFVKVPQVGEPLAWRTTV
jgi:hypothetical protein